LGGDLEAQHGKNVQDCQDCPKPIESGGLAPAAVQDRAVGLENI